MCGTSTRVPLIVREPAGPFLHVLATGASEAFDLAWALAIEDAKAVARIVRGRKCRGYADLFDEVASASVIESPTGDVETNPVLQGAPKRLTQEEAETLQHYQYIVTFGWLKSWTINHPFPQRWEDLLETPLNVIDALGVEVNLHAVQDPADDMEISKETLEDKGSFTGSSAASKTSSQGTGKRRSSARKQSTS